MSRGTWFFVVIAVGIAVLGNYVSAMWARSGDPFSLWFFGILIISPFVFITFGLVASRVSLAVGAGTIDSLLSLSTIAVGLVVFKEWAVLSTFQYLGIAFVILGLILIQHKRISRFPRAHAHRLLKVCLSLTRGGGMNISVDTKKR